MNVKSVGKQYNPSMQAMYFPKTPRHLYIDEPNLRQAIQNNPYLKRLSEEADILVRMPNNSNLYYHLSVDVVDLKAKQVKYSMSYMSKHLYETTIRLLKEKFISEIKPPKGIKPDCKGNLSKKINKIDKDYEEKNEYYNFNFYSVNNICHLLWKVDPDAPAEFKNSLIQAYGYRVSFNKAAMEEIVKGI